LFFCDFGPELAAAVTKGRRGEFGKFERFRNPAVQATIPDPNDPATYAASKLDWSQIDHGPHAEWLALYRELLALRRSHIVPRLAGMRSGGRFSLNGSDVLCVDWTLGDGARLHLVVNFSRAPCGGIDVPAGDLLYASGLPAEGDLTRSVLPAYSVMFTLETAA
jgi:maltooligosyltrehalose trehalohydrolase